MSTPRLQQIDFYVLPNADYKTFACRLLAKAYQENHRIYVHTQTEQMAKQLNDLLWTFHDISFIPHHLVNTENGTNSPITIGHAATPITHEANHNILLLLNETLPDKFDQFERLILVIPEEEKWKTSAREHYKKLVQQGYKVSTHTIH